ncbi:MAG: DNA-protecting protein DprA [Nitrospirae bacterium]|nr:DNA-protecting protein DprA [Nitrospirota bacterium]
MSDLKYWLALNLLPDIGPFYARRLLSAFGSPENIFQMPAGELKKIEGIGENRAKSIAGFRQWDIVDKEISYAEKNNIKILPFKDPLYPERLRQIPDAPLLLYVKGDIKDDDKYAIAIVGSRTPTDYGLQVAERISYKLAAYGLTVVSGMARGIDGASHKGALMAGGRTLAVLGSVIDVPYPLENKGLMRALVPSGALISEFPLGTKPNTGNFPKRNRIISGLSLGVLVIEAGVDSGSLITVGYALEQGREVFAVPGNITSKTSKGTNDLIKKGAKLVENADEIINELAPQIKVILKEAQGAERQQNISAPAPHMTESEKKVYNILCKGPKHIDAITREINIPASEALSTLLSLELKGAVRQMDGKNFLAANC